MLQKKKRKKEVSLAKIFFSLVLIAGVAIGISYLKEYVDLGSLSLSNPVANLESLAHARELYDQGQIAQAEEALEPLARGGGDAAGPQAAILLARLYEDQGQGDKAVGLLEEAYGEYSESVDYARVAVAYARALEDSGNLERAAAIFSDVRDSAPPELRAPALTGLGRKAERENDLFGARKLYREAVEDAKWDSPAWNEALDALGEVNTRLIFAKMKTPESKTYTVERGDSITGIGNKLNTTQGLLMRANGLTEHSILNINQQLKYTPKNFKIIIERSKCRLFVVDKDGIFKRYQVGLGKPGHETTLGTYKIGNKEKNPTWHKPGEGPIPPGDPRNELGTRWMPLVPDQEGLPPDLGIHGTIRPETVGFYSSNGCARMLPEAVEELYDLVVRATPVEIVEAYPGTEPATPETKPAVFEPEREPEPPAAVEAAAPEPGFVPGMPESPSGS